MARLSDLLEAGQPIPRRPVPGATFPGALWPRAIVTEPTWSALAVALAAGDLTLVSLWGEADAVHMALREEASGATGIATFLCPEGRFPSVGAHHAPAQRLERAACDLFGLQADGASDHRPWLDHGTLETAAPRPYPFLTAEAIADEGGVEASVLHQIPVGPVHAGIIEPGHFRFTCHGETVVRLEARLGYVHRGVEALMAGADVAAAGRLAGRASGDSTVAYALAFARAVEAASGLVLPPRAHGVRAVAAELERLANHFGDVGAICNDAAFALMLAHCGVLRERCVRAGAVAFGRRLMMDVIVPGGVAHDLEPEGITALRALVKTVRGALPALVRLYEETVSLKDRTLGTGRVSAALARQFGAGGFVGRASGRGFDARRDCPYPPYDRLPFTVPVRPDGDVDARIWIRLLEIEESLSLITRLLETLPSGPVALDPGAFAPDQAGDALREGVALVEGFRGDIFAFVRLDPAGRVARAHLRDPSWFQWPLLEAAIEGNIVADFPLCNKSFNCSYAGHDL